MESADVSSAQPTASHIYIGYTLMGLGLFTGVFAILGVIWAYIRRANCCDFDKTHYSFLIRTFWFGFLWFVISVLLGIILIGYFIFLAAWFWCCYRLIKGVLRLKNSKEI